MGVGPPESPIRRRLQTTASCAGTTAGVVSVAEKAPVGLCAVWDRPSRRTDVVALSAPQQQRRHRGARAARKAHGYGLCPADRRFRPTAAAPRMNRRLAGRSANRRIYQANHSEP
jgi:hypothetical protein